VGKSSLLNCLAGQDRAIVTAVPGTTRDALRECIQIEGVTFNLVDTAGLRDAEDEVEALGIERTWREIGRTDVALTVFDARAGIGAEDRAILDRLPADVRRISVFNKIDLLPGTVAGRREGAGDEVYVSALTGAGADELRRALLSAAGWESGGESLFLARERHLRALAAAQAHLDGARHQLGRWEFVAEELRLAQAALAAITGEFSADDLLGEIFARFCIGK
jgi:tRNA modification GTPase